MTVLSLLSGRFFVCCWWYSRGHRCGSGGAAGGGCGRGSGGRQDKTSKEAANVSANNH